MLISSHDVDDIERIVDRTTIIKQGRLVTDLDLEKLRKTWRQVEVTRPQSNNDSVDNLAARIPENWIGLVASGRRLKFTDTGYQDELCERKLNELYGENLEISAHPLSLRDAYVEIAKLWK